MHYIGSHGFFIVKDIETINDIAKADVDTFGLPGVKPTGRALKRAVVVAKPLPDKEWHDEGNKFVMNDFYEEVKPGDTVIFVSGEEDEIDIGTFCVSRNKVIAFKINS